MADKKYINLPVVPVQKTTDIYALSDSGVGSYRETRAQQNAYWNANVNIPPAQISNISAFSLVGNFANIPFSGANITLGNTLTFSGSALQTTGLTGDVTSSANSFATTLATVNASIGTFGSATQVAQFTVNAKGLITSASNVTIAGIPPSGAAGGDLSGTYPNPTVARINGVTLGPTTATAGNLLIGSGVLWNSTPMSGDATINGTGGLTIANNAITTPKIANAAVDLTTKVTGILPIINGGTNISTYTLGDTLYCSSINVLSKLAGNTTTTKQYLSQTGTGTVSSAPVWSAISGSDITGAALTSVNDTNITLTLGGTPATALLRAASITAGWTGVLSIARGGNNINGQTTNGVLFNNGTANVSSGSFTYNGTKVAIDGGSAGVINNLFSILSKRSFAPANDGIMISALSSNGTLGSHDYGAIVIGSNPTSGDGGASIFQLRVGGSATNTTANGLFLQATSGTLNNTTEVAIYTGASVKVFSINGSGRVNVVSLNPSSPVFTDASQNLSSTGIVPVSSGGTGLTSGTSGGIPYFNSATTMLSSSVLGSNQVMVGGGAGSAPKTDSVFTYLNTTSQLSILTGLTSPRLTISTSSVTAGNESSIFLNRGSTASGFAQIHFLSNNVEDWAIGTRLGSSDFSIFKNSTSLTPYLFSFVPSKYEFTVNTNVTGSTNESAITLNRGDKPNGASSVYFKTASNSDFILQTQAGFSNLYVYSNYNPGSGTVGNVVAIDPTGLVNYPKTASVLAYVPSSIVNFTGNSGALTIPFSAISYDQNGNFNTGTFQFTAPVPGVYLITITVALSSINANNNIGNISVIVGGTTFVLEQFQPFNYAMSGGFLCHSASTCAKINSAGVLISGQLTISGNVSNNVTLAGGLSNTRMCISLIA